MININLVQKHNNAEQSHFNCLNNLTGIRFLATGTQPHQEGKIYWDGTDHTLAIMTEQSGTTLQVGQENFVRIVNKTNNILPDGKIVYINGSQGNRPTAELAIASNHEHIHKVIGVATSDIAINQEGYVTTFGLVRGLNTNSYNVGDFIYLSSTNSGEYTNQRPLYPNYAHSIGTILVSHLTQGVLFVKPSNEEFGRVLMAENSANATTLGSVVKKVEIFNSSGDSLGFIPIYNSIS